MKRIITIVLALSMLFALTGCGKTTVTVKETTLSGTKCGNFTVSGASFGNSGKVKVTGTVVDRYGKLRTLNNAAYQYTKSGNTVSMKADSRYTVPGKITGNYNSSTNTFVLDAKSMDYCEIYNYFR